jgi:hypothetical protein
MQDLLWREKKRYKIYFEWRLFIWARIEYVNRIYFNFGFRSGTSIRSNYQIEILRQNKNVSMWSLEI